MDVVYGNLERILHEPMSDERKFGVITVMPARGHWCRGITPFAGQLTIWRNEDKVNAIFKGVSDWEEQFKKRFSKMDELNVASPSLDSTPILFLESQFTTQRLDGSKRDTDTGTVSCGFRRRT